MEELSIVGEDTSVLTCWISWEAINRWQGRGLRKCKSALIDADLEMLLDGFGPLTAYFVSLVTRIWLSS